MPHSIDTKWFQDRLADRKMSQRQLAKHLGLDSSAVSLTFRGKRLMKLTEAADIARLIGAPLDEVLAHAGVHEASKGRQIAVAGIHDDHGEVHWINEKFSVPTPTELPETCIAIQARTSDFRDGWLLFLEQPSTVASDAIGRFSLVRLKNGVMTLGQVRRSYIPGRFSIDSPDVATKDVELEWAEPIILIKPV